MHLPCGFLFHELSRKRACATCESFGKKIQSWNSLRKSFTHFSSLVSRSSSFALFEASSDSIDVILTRAWFTFSLEVTTSSFCSWTLSSSRDILLFSSPIVWIDFKHSSRSRFFSSNAVFWSFSYCCVFLFKASVAFDCSIDLFINFVFRSLICMTVDDERFSGDDFGEQLHDFFCISNSASSLCWSRVISDILLFLSVISDLRFSISEIKLPFYGIKYWKMKETS